MIATKTLLLMVMGRSEKLSSFATSLARSHGPSPGSVYRHNENCEKTTIGLSKKATLHVQHTFFVHFFAVVLHDFNVKLLETSWLCDL